MNFNIWNIKEMLNTPTATGPNKFSVRTSAPSDYSSLSDSQLLFGSQFCPENTHSAAAPLELGTQHNSQDSEPSIFTKYQSKPQLFEDDPKEKASLTFGAGRAKSVLENFEANKTNIKDRYDREVLSSFLSSIKDRLQGVQTCLDKLGEMFDSRNKSILVHLETIAKTLQDALRSHCASVLEALTEKSQAEQALLEMERRLAAKDVELRDVKSSIQRLREGLESLPAQLGDRHLKLCEELGFLGLPAAVAELHACVSRARLPARVADNASQTSPGQENARQPCRRARGVCGSAGRPQLGDSPARSRVTGDGAGGEASPAAAAAYGRGDAVSQEPWRGVEGQGCAMRTRGRVAGCGQQRCPVPQEVPLPTPLRKAVRRGSRGFTPLAPAQHWPPQGGRLPVRREVPGPRHSTPPVAREMESVGSRAKPRAGRIPWNKGKGRKKARSSCAAGGLQQRKAAGLMELESSRRGCFPGYAVAPNSGSTDSDRAAPLPRILGTAQPRLPENLPPAPSSDTNPQPADKSKRSWEIKKPGNVSSGRRNLWDSSPQENVFSLCSTTGADRAACFSLRSPASAKKPGPRDPLAQPNAACCSLLFDSDYSD